MHLSLGNDVVVRTRSKSVTQNPTQYLVRSSKQFFGFSRFQCAGCGIPCTPSHRSHRIDRAKDSGGIKSIFVGGFS